MHHNAAVVVGSDRNEGRRGSQDLRFDRDSTFRCLLQHGTDQCRCQYCGITDKPCSSSSISSKAKPARCVLTGRSGALKLAHLVPASANEDILRCLKLRNDEAGIWSVRNALLLALDFARAFHRTRLSFEPHPLQQNTYKLKIWDPSVRDELVWQGATVEKVTGDNTIGFYE
eukprot:gene41596-55150_t